jgi:hypothetical protein
MEKSFAIKNQETGEYWNNKIGWVDRNSATLFTEEDKDTFLYIPLDGEWEKVCPLFESNEGDKVCAWRLFSRRCGRPECEIPLIKCKED